MREIKVKTRRIEKYAHGEAVPKKAIFMSTVPDEDFGYVHFFLVERVEVSNEI